MLFRQPVRAAHALLRAGCRAMSGSGTGLPCLPAATLLEDVGLPGGDAHATVPSTTRFSDGGQFRIEIPSCVVEEAKRYDVPVHRVSQGTGIFLLTTSELKDMCRVARDHLMELCLFVGPRNAWDVSATARTDAGRNTMGHRGADALAAALEDVRYACDAGLRSVLVADYGLVDVIGRLKAAGKLPANLVVKVSVQIGPANPSAARLLDTIGATTLNTPTDLTVPQLAALRQVTDCPLDVYVEAPDDFGGYVRHYEAAKMIAACSPLYLKLGLRNSPNIYPSGTHLEGTAVALSRERVRRARILLDIVERCYPAAHLSDIGDWSDLGIPDV